MPGEEGKARHEEQLEGDVGQTLDASKQGISLGGFGLRIKTEDIARFGQLYLQKGERKRPCLVGRLESK